MTQTVDGLADWAGEGETFTLTMLRDRISAIRGFFVRRYLVILLFALVGLLIGLGYLFLTPPIYTASSTMVIDTRKSQYLQQSSLGEGDASWMDTQIGTIKSHNVALLAVRRLHLADDPKFARYDPRLSLILPSWIIRRIGLVNREAQFSENDLAWQIVAGLDVKRVGSSYMVRVEFSSYDAEQTVKIVNAIVDAYVADQLNARDESNRRTSDWLQERFQTLREQAAAAERAVVDYKAKNNIATNEGKTVSDHDMGALSTQLASARSHTEDILARLGRIETVLHQIQDGGSMTATVSDEFNNPIIQKLRAQYLDLENRKALWETQYGPKHQAVVSLGRQLSDIRSNIADELGRIAESYKSEIEISKTRQQAQEKQWADFVSQPENPSQIQLHTLQSAADSYRTLYNDFLQKYMESVQQQSFPANEAHLLSPAAGAYKSSPKRTAVWSLALLAGAIFGGAFGAFRELMDSGFRTRQQVRSTLDTDCLALVPFLKDDVPELGYDDGQAVERAIPAKGSRTISFNVRAIRAIVDDPLSQYAESFRSIKLALDQANISKSARDPGLQSSRFAKDLANAPKSSLVVGLTSSLPEEGKSTIAAGLSELVAIGGRRVILLDCDFRNPTLTRTLTPNASAGLLEVLAGKAALEETIWRDPITKLEFLPASGPNSIEKFERDLRH